MPAALLMAYLMFAIGLPGTCFVAGLPFWPAEAGEVRGDRAGRQLWGHAVRRGGGDRNRGVSLKQDLGEKV